MIELSMPWLSLAVLCPLIGAWTVWWLNGQERRARQTAVVFALVTLVCTVAAWLELLRTGAEMGQDAWDVLADVFGEPVLTIDLLSAPLLPLAAALYLVTVLVTLGTKLPRYSFCGSLVSHALLVGALSTRQPWFIIACAVVGTVPPVLEIWARGRAARLFVWHMAAFAALLVVGQFLLDHSSVSRAKTLGVGCLLGATFIRAGCVPLHLWVTELMEQATFSTALLFLSRMFGAYVAARLVLPYAPEWALRMLVGLSAITALYSAAMSLVQRDARRFFAYLFLSQSSLVFVGLETLTLIGLTGALSTWLSVMLAVCGFGLVLRAVEARIGRLSLARYHGLYEQVPPLANFFLLSGLASVGFPGTFGFIGAELLVEGALETSPHLALIVILSAALCGIGVLQAYFRVFTGRRPEATVALKGRPSERWTVVVLTVIILAGGVFPQPGLLTRYHAAETLLAWRQQVQQTTTAAGQPMMPATDSRVVHFIPRVGSQTFHPRSLRTQD